MSRETALFRVQLDGARENFPRLVSFGDQDADRLNWGRHYRSDGFCADNSCGSLAMLARFAGVRSKRLPNLLREPLRFADARRIAGTRRSATP